PSARPFGLPEWTGFPDTMCTWTRTVWFCFPKKWNSEGGRCGPQKGCAAQKNRGTSLLERHDEAGSSDRAFFISAGNAFELGRFSFRLDLNWPCGKRYIG